MAQLTRSQFDTLYNSSGSGTFLDNSTQAIVEASMRAFAKDIEDSVLFIGDNTNTDTYYSFQTDFETDGGASIVANGFNGFYSGAAFSTGIISGDAAKNVYGAMYLYGGSSVGNYSTLARSGANLVFNIGFTSIFTYRACTQSLSNGTNRYNARIGLKNLTDLTDNYGSYFRYSDNVNSGKWQAVTKSGGVETATDTGITANTNYHTFEIRANSAGTSITFYIDGVLVATNTTNIPTSSINPLGSMIQVERVLGSSTTTTYLSIDWYREILTRTTAR